MFNKSFLKKQVQKYVKPIKEVRSGGVKRDSRVEEKKNAE